MRPSRKLTAAQMETAKLAWAEAKSQIPSIPKFARELGLTRSAISQWEIVPIDRGIDVEKMSGVSRSKLCPDVYPDESALVVPSRVSELHEYLEEVIDLLHALDRVGDGIGGADGYSVSAVALAAKSVADNALNAVGAMGGTR